MTSDNKLEVANAFLTRRVDELLNANNVEVERRRKAEHELEEAQERNAALANLLADTRSQLDEFLADVDGQAPAESDPHVVEVLVEDMTKVCATRDDLAAQLADAQAAVQRAEEDAAQAVSQAARLKRERDYLAQQINSIQEGVRIAVAILSGPVTVDTLMSVRDRLAAYELNPRRVDLEASPATDVGTAVVAPVAPRHPSADEGRARHLAAFAKSRASTNGRHPSTNNWPIQPV